MAERIYQEDYKAMSGLQDITKTYNVALVVVQHERKTASIEDWLENISGSQAITGGADSILTLKRERSRADAILKMTGRDFEEEKVYPNLDEFLSNDDKKIIVAKINEIV